MVAVTTLNVSILTLPYHTEHMRIQTPLFQTEAFSCHLQLALDTPNLAALPKKKDFRQIPTPCRVQTTKRYHSSLESEPQAVNRNSSVSVSHPTFPLELMGAGCNFRCPIRQSLDDCLIDRGLRLKIGHQGIAVFLCLCLQSIPCQVRP